MQFLEVLILLLLFCGTLPMILPRIKAIYTTSIITIILLICVAVYIQINVGYFGSFVFGNFYPSVGIEHKVDNFSYFLVAIIVAVGIYTSYSVLRNIKSVHTKYISCFVTIAIASSLILAITKDIFNFYIFFELCNICFYLIFSNTTDTQKKKHVLEYLLLGSVASVFIVFSIEIIYIIYGTLNISTLEQVGYTLAGKPLILMKIATLFMLITCFIKLGIFPFNIWVRKIYTLCPNFFLPFYAAVSSSLILYLVVFFLYYIIKSYDIILFSSIIITPFCLATIAIFSILCLKEKDLRVIFAYSTLAQVSYSLIALTTPNVSAISGGILHLIHNSICKFGIFVIICQLYATHKSYNISVLSGLYKNKIAFVCFCILCLSLIGVPLTSGFVSKFYMFQGLIEEKRFVSIAFFTLGSILSIMYLWRIIKPIFLQESHSSMQMQTVGEVSTILITLVSIFFGFFTHITLEKSQTLATIFLQNLS